MALLEPQPIQEKESQLMTHHQDSAVSTISSRRRKPLPIRRTLPILLLLIWALATGPVHADNIIDASGFNNPSDVVAWDPGFDGVTVTWDTRDAHQSLSSGSLKLKDSKLLAGNGFTTIGRCFLVTPGLKYRFRAKTLVPAGQARTTKVLAQTSYNATSNCNNNHILTTLDSNQVVTSGQWQDLQITDFVAPEFAHSVWIRLGSSKQQAGGSVDVLFDEVYLEELTGACVSAPGTLCLGDNRFSVTIDWLTPAGDEGVGTAVPMTLDSGLFWFFEPSNLELLIKVLDACSFTSNYWVFFAATTNVNYRLTVTDTQTGGIKQYINPQNTLAQSVADIEAFPCS